MKTTWSFLEELNRYCSLFRIKRFTKVSAWPEIATQLKRRLFLVFDFMAKFKKGKPWAQVLKPSKRNFKVLH